MKAFWFMSVILVLVGLYAICSGEPPARPRKPDLADDRKRPFKLWLDRSPWN